MKTLVNCIYTTYAYYLAVPRAALRAHNHNVSFDGQYWSVKLACRLQIGQALHCLVVAQHAQVGHIERHLRRDGVVDL